MLSPPACHHPTSFLLFNNNRLTYVFPFTLSWPSPFPLCVILKSTKRHLEQARICNLKMKQILGWITLKVVKLPQPKRLLIITYLCTSNLYHKTYIQNCPLYIINKI
jgi:hypothetical protein